MTLEQRLRDCAPDGLLAAHVSDLTAIREAADELAALRARVAMAEDAAA